MFLHIKMDGWLDGREVAHWTMSDIGLGLSFYDKGKVGEGRQKIPGVQPWQSLRLELLCMKRSDLLG